MESVCAGNRTVGSNPTLSASYLVQLIVNTSVLFEAVARAPKCILRKLGTISANLLKTVKEAFA